jgi:hypothetical protein
MGTVPQLTRTPRIGLSKSDWLGSRTLQSLCMRGSDRPGAPRPTLQAQGGAGITSIAKLRDAQHAIHVVYFRHARRRTITRP